MANEQLYSKIKAGFISKGTSLNKWCKQNGYHRQNAAAAIKGDWVGEKATLLCNLLIVESGVDLKTCIDSSSSPIYFANSDLYEILNQDDVKNDDSL